jgi:hypothetical protein
VVLFFVFFCFVVDASQLTPHNFLQPIVGTALIPEAAAAVSQPKSLL